MCNWSDGVEARATARGLAKGLEQGLEQGHEDILEMNKYLLSHERYNDLERASYDDKFRESILAEIAKEKSESL